MSIEIDKPHRKRNKKIKPSPNLPGSDSAQSYWALANNFMDAAEQLLEQPSGKGLAPILYLLGHSLELHFKAFLILKGVTEKELSSDFGHDLVACLDQCKKRGLCQHLSLSYSQIRQIVRVNRYYQGKQLEYFYTTAKQFGAIENLRDIVRQTSKALFTPITDNDFRTIL